MEEIITPYKLREERLIFMEEIFNVLLEPWAQLMYTGVL